MIRKSPEQEENESKKPGLALSGGGLRAAYFHLGVLSRMADQDLLRHIEVLSCVSGGAIIGAQYYLKLKNLLESKPDKNITTDDYIAIVKSVTDDFHRAAKTNFRMTALSLFSKSMIRTLSAGLSLAEVLGGLYDKRLFSPLTGKRYVSFRELLIHPYNDIDPFFPVRDNPSRKAKVPILYINSTCLNTGNPWRFTCTTMYEDALLNKIIPTIHYASCKSRYQELPLAEGVAASTCVPGIFEPVALTRLFDNVIVRLVDGGVYDNQGFLPLLDEGCTKIIISDASTILIPLADPGEGLMSTLSRSNQIMMERIKFSHLQVLENVINRPTYINFNQSDKGKDTGEGYVPTQINSALSRIRTDLDSFNDIEAYSLMTAGYRSAERNFVELLPISPLGQPVKWPFLDIEPYFSDPRLLKMINVAKKRVFKIFRLIPFRSSLVLLIILFIIAMGLILLQEFRTALIISVGLPLMLPLCILILYLIERLIHKRSHSEILSIESFSDQEKWGKIRRSGRKASRSPSYAALAIFSAFAIAPLAWIYIKFLNPLYLNMGDFDRFILKRRHKGK